MKRWCAMVHGENEVLGLTHTTQWVTAADGQQAEALALLQASRSGIQRGHVVALWEHRPPGRVQRALEAVLRAGRRARDREVKRLARALRASAARSTALADKLDPLPRFSSATTGRWPEGFVLRLPHGDGVGPLPHGPSCRQRLGRN